MILLSSNGLQEIGFTSALPQQQCDTPCHEIEGQLDAFFPYKVVILRVSYMTTRSIRSRYNSRVTWILSQLQIAGPRNLPSHRPQRQRYPKFCNIRWFIIRATRTRHLVYSSSAMLRKGSCSCFDNSNNCKAVRSTKYPEKSSVNFSPSSSWNGKM